MNPDLCKAALAKVVNPNVLVNLISRRVRQLNAGGGGNSRPLIAKTENMGACDIALTEIVEGKMGWEMPDYNVLVAEAKPKRKRKS
jgi:DNA-directed RNA polymerase subunit omega